MKPQRQIPESTLRAQATASDPDSSAWVSANAGSGKTHVLAQRVIRLLLGKTDPSKILCLTYTRAAAANMSNRVFRELSAWTALPDAELAQQIANLEDAWPDAGKLRLARRLFSKALETPGGLKIQTIHAFCEAVLHQFPLEANIAAHFQLLDSQMEQALFSEARRDMISGAADGGNPVLADAFATVLERAGEFGLDLLLDEIIAKRARIRSFIDRLHSLEPPNGHLYPALFEEFGFNPAESAQTIAEAVWPLPGFDRDAFAAFRRAAEKAGASMVQNNILPDAVAGFGESDPVRRLELLAQAFLTKDGDFYSPRTFTKGLLALMPDAQERYAEAAQALRKARENLAMFRMLEGSCAALTIADMLIGRYEHLKTRRGFLDFGDLITRTVRLLARDDAGPWVQYKLDRGIDHILLDEAQDTSPDQWEVVKRLASEFFAGAGARDEVRRTIFAVGDEKQSIYSFQGAAPQSFAESGQEFSRTVKAAQRRFEPVRLEMSFRSTPDILEAVDRVFRHDETRRGLSQFTVVHSAIRHDNPGYVELWPSLGAEQVEEPDDWRMPVNHLAAPAIRLADQIAKTIDRWVNEGEILEGRGTRVSPGDVLVLVRKRDRFVHALSRSLKERGIAVAGADRLRLSNHIAVQDLLALGHFLLQSQDDLALASVLKSPIFGLEEEDLFSIAAQRPSVQSLDAALRLQAQTDDRMKAIVATLDRWRDEASFKPPFEFYSGVLQRDGVRLKMMARLGHEAGDMLDEFLSFCLAQEQTGLPGLEAMITTLESVGPEIKREMDQARREVRIMTVHASKGLEAPIVFLVDSGSAPISSQHLPHLMPFTGKAVLAGTQGYLWNSGAEVKNETTRAIADELKDLADDEYRRLLYVGMTRAEDRLVVCGYHGKAKQNARSWHAIVERALSDEMETQTITHPTTGEDVLRFRSSVHSTEAHGPQEEAAPLATEPPAAPNLGPTPSPELLPRPLTPSGAAAMIAPTLEVKGSTRSPVLDETVEPAFAVERGRIIHKLLQVVPGLLPAEREAAAHRYLSYAAANWNEAERDGAWRSVAAILEDERFGAAFAPGSRAEVSLMGTIRLRGRNRLVSGQIDRLAVGDRQVLITDYKTNRNAPGSAAEVDPAYTLQMALYAELLKPLYPDKTIRAALLYTEKPVLIELPDALLATALARLTQA